MENSADVLYILARGIGRTGPVVYNEPAGYDYRKKIDLSVFSPMFGFKRKPIKFQTRFLRSMNCFFNATDLPDVI